jgi:hypothetical protein
MGDEHSIDEMSYFVEDSDLSSIESINVYSTSRASTSTTTRPAAATDSVLSGPFD